MDEKTCERLYQTYYLRVYSYLVTLSNNRDLAEELTEETFYRAFLAGDGFRGDANEMTWLCAIAKNLFFDEARKRNRMAELPEDADSGIDVERAAADKDLSFRIHMILHGLEEPYREVFELRVFGDLSFRQIGTVFGKTENWARVTYHRARLRIQERMGEK